MVQRYVGCCGIRGLLLGKPAQSMYNVLNWYTKILGLIVVKVKIGRNVDPDILLLKLTESLTI
jgi:hypothetical protein